MLVSGWIGFFEGDLPKDFKIRATEYTTGFLATTARPPFWPDPKDEPKKLTQHTLESRWDRRHEAVDRLGRYEWTITLKYGDVVEVLEP